MDYKLRPELSNGKRATKEEDELLRLWIKDFLKTEDMAIVEIYYLSYTMSTNRHFKMDMLLKDLSTLSKHEFIVKWSHGLFTSGPIGYYVYDREIFDEDFPELYEKLPKLNA